jgi:DNA repair exonuclease SbcCD nuclease subunit
MEKDPERRSDSLVTFEEILQLAQEKKVLIHNHVHRDE